jgi:hypothetical protein
VSPQRRGSAWKPSAVASGISTSTPLVYAEKNLPSDLPEARAIEPARFGRLGASSWVEVWGAVERGISLLSLSLLLVSLMGTREELDPTSGRVWRLCDLLLALLFSDLGALLRLRPCRYFSAGFRKIPDEAPIRSVLVPSREDAVPVTGSHRRFSIKIGLER